jgi:hypothetical protein
MKSHPSVKCGDARCVRCNPRPSPSPPPAPVKGVPPPRRLLFKGAVLYEVGEDGRLWLAGDDGRREDVARRFYRQLDAQINFPHKPGGWSDG